MTVYRHHDSFRKCGVKLEMAGMVHPEDPFGALLPNIDSSLGEINSATVVFPH